MVAMYDELAEWWPLLSPAVDYAEEAAIFTDLFEAHTRRPIERVLELGSGGGSIASFFKARWDLVLVDLSPRMLEVSARLNPECRHVEGDMCSVRMGERFDAVFVHDAVTYLTSEEQLRAMA